MKDEVETNRIIEWCFRHHKQIAVPKTVHPTLEFYLIQSMDELKEGTFGVKEPFTNQRIDIQEIQCMIVPLSAFDNQLHRTGYGAGYYDSVLTNIMLKVGIAYSCQEVDTITVDPWDVSLNQVITEKNYEDLDS